MRTRSILAVLLLSAPVGAGAQTVTGAIRGVIEDPTSARVANARVDLERSGSSLSHHVTAGTRGEFRVEGLPPGSWRLKINAAGFATASADFTILISSTQDVTLTLQLPTVRQTAGVSATGSSVTGN
jgi:hypothetical protein